MVVKIQLKYFNRRIFFSTYTAAVLTEGDIFLSGGTTLKGFGRAGNEANGTWASGDAINTARDSGGFFGSKNAALLGGCSPSLVQILL